MRISALTWQPAPDNFIFIAADLGSRAPFATPNGLITITTSATPTPTPPIPVCTPKPVTPNQIVLDHFKAYVTSGPPNGDQVQLRDQFDPPDDRMSRPRLFRSRRSVRPSGSPFQWRRPTTP